MIFREGTVELAIPSSPWTSKSTREAKPTNPQGRGTYFSACDFLLLQSTLNYNLMDRIYIRALFSPD
jgi:hypothetical protein